MFFVLCCQKCEKSFAKRIREIFKSEPLKIDKITVKDCLPFYRITVKNQSGKLPFSEIEKAAGKLCTRAVLPKNVTLPKNTALKRFIPKVFPQRVLFNSALSVIKSLELDPVRMYVTVFDENGYLIDLIRRLLPFSCMIRVVTWCADAYEKEADAILKQYGASLVIMEKFEPSILESTVIISDKSGFLSAKYKGILFTNERCRTLGEVFYSDKIAFPEQLDELFCGDISRLDIAGALYELCSFKDFENTEYIYG